MSGGYFDYAQYRIEEIAVMIDEVTRINDHLDEQGAPVGRGYGPDTIDRFREAAFTLRRAAAMAQRVDMLLSCDDDENSFHSLWGRVVPPEHGKTTRRFPGGDR